MGHYYKADGTACYFVPKKDGKGERATNIKDARELALLPSVTEVLGILDKPGLNRWKIEQAVHAVVTAPDVPGEGLDAKIERILYSEAQQDEEAKIARDRGTELHAKLEQWLQSGSPKPIDDPWVRPASQFILDYGGTIAGIETVVVGKGYAGRLDLALRFDDRDVLVDFKTAKNLPKPFKGLPQSWPEHKIQLAAYAYAWKQNKIETVNLYISTSEQGGYIWCSNGVDWIADYYCFENILWTWAHLKGYFPPGIEKPV